MQRRSKRSKPGGATKAVVALPNCLPLGLFAVVASRIRVEILGALRDRPSDVTSLADRLELAGDLVSYHLRQLRRHDLVAFRSEHTRRIYSLSPEVRISVDTNGVCFEVDRGESMRFIVRTGGETGR